MLQRNGTSVIGMLGGVGLLSLVLVFVLGNVNTSASGSGIFYQPSIAQMIPNDATTLFSGSYTGTIAINEPLALGVLDISLIITETNDVLTGILNDSGSLAFSHAAALTGNITSRTATSATFTLTSAPSTSLISGRQVTRAFTINGSVHENGDIILGGYEEQITGFTPQPLIAQGMFLATRPRSVVGATLVGVTPTATPTSGPETLTNRIYLPIVKR